MVVVVRGEGVQSEGWVSSRIYLQRLTRECAGSYKVRPEQQGCLIGGRPIVYKHLSPQTSITLPQPVFGIVVDIELLKGIYC